MFYIISFLIIGISLSPLFLQKPDIWHCQGIFAQTVIMMAFAWSFIEKSKQRLVSNWPLGCLILWVGLQTAYICWQSQIQGRYDVKHFFPYFNFICLLFLYQMIVQYLDKSHIEKILSIMKYVVIGTLFMCVLQKFDLSQFFEILKDKLEPALKSKSHMLNNPVSGFLGNGTHLSGFLGSTIPLFLWKSKREDWLALGLMALVLMNCGTTIGMPSISGILTIFCILVYWFRNKWLTLLAVIVFIGAVIGYFAGIKFFSATGRIAIWEYYWGVFSKMPITGFGLGTVNILYPHTPIPDARHVHLEYLQYGVEIGIIGLVCILGMVNNFFHIVARDKTELCLKACILGFLVTGFLNYPSKLWLVSVWAMFWYAALFAIRNEEKIYGIEPQRDN